MTLRPICFAASILVMLLAAFRTTQGATSPHAPEPAKTALNHWIYDAGDANAADIRKLADDMLAHVRQAHPEATLSYFRELVEVEGNFVHLFLETQDSAVQQAYIDAHGRGDSCQQLFEREERLFELKSDLNMRLIASDPEKEQRMGRFGGTTVWTFETHFLRIGQAIECVDKLVRHLNASYPDFAFRGYDQWYPESGCLRIYAFGTGIPVWEQTEAKIRRDPVVRELMEGASEAFVAGGFDDTWLALITR